MNYFELEVNYFSNNDELFASKIITLEDTISTIIGKKTEILTHHVNLFPFEFSSTRH